MNEEQQAELTNLETEIRTSDDQGLRARWSFGKVLLQLRIGERLPNLVRARISAQVGIPPGEVSKRLLLAEKYPTEEELCAVVTQFKSWHAIVHEALVTKKGTPKTMTAAQRLCNSIVKFDRASADEHDGRALMRAMQDLIADLSHIDDRRAAA